MAYEHEGNMVNEFPVSGWKEYWESLINENTAFRARVARLEEALRELLDYTRACEGLLNASESGTCVKARRALEEK